MKRKKIVILPQVNDAGGDVSKKWFVYYSYRDPRTDKMKRFKIYAGLHKIKDKEKRMAAAEELRDELRGKLKNGWNPFMDDSEVIYEDQLQYNTISKVYGKIRAANKSVRFYSSQFIEQLIKEGKLEDETIRTYTSKLRTFCMWLDKCHLGDNDITTIENIHVIDFFNFLIAERKLSGNSIKKYRQILRNMFEAARKDKTIMMNPVFDIPDCRRVNDQAPRPIAEFDILPFKEAIEKEDPQLWMAIEFEYYCFLRPGKELRFLKISDIDFTRGIIDVDKIRAKTNRERFPTIPTVFLKKLREVYQLHRYPKNFYVLGNKKEPGPVPLSKNTLKNRFRYFREKLNMPDSYKFYSWKHTGNGRASDAGIETRVLQEQNGHSSIKTTELYMRHKIGKVSREIRDGFPEL